MSREVKKAHVETRRRGETEGGLKNSPSVWAVACIGELTVRTQQRNPNRNPEDRFRYVDVSSVSNTSFRITDPAELLGAQAPSRARKVIRTGDVLFATVRPTLKRVALVPEELDDQIGSTGFIVLRADASRLESHYLYYRLLTDDFTQRMRELERGASYPAVRDSDICNEEIPVPPLTEQRKIAGVLGLVQRAMEQQERLIALTTELKKALLHQIFTQGLHGEPKNQTNIGPMPESWAVVPLGEYLTEAQYGISAKGSESGRYAVLRMTNQHQGRISSANLQYVELTADQFQKFRIKRQDILFNRTNSLDLVGRTAIFDLEGDFVFASYLIRLRTDAERLRPFFLNYYFNWEETQVRLKSIATRAVTQTNISASRLRGFVVPVPKVGEQDEIVEKIDCLDQKLLTHARKYVALIALFRTLLHQLMTARLRVHNIDLSEFWREPE